MFNLWETVYICANNPPCQHPSGVWATRRPKVVTESLIPGHQSGYDVMVYVGRHRFSCYWQRAEILEGLEKQGIDIALGTASGLIKKYPRYLRMLHDDETVITKIRRVLEADGGYWIHIDATCENGRGTTFAIYVGKRHWILEAGKIPTENAEEILPYLRRVVARYGIPLAIVSDMGKGMLCAIDTLIQELGPHGAEVVRLICHLHFLRDIGGDMLRNLHNQLCKKITASKARARIRDLIRDLTKATEDREQARQQVCAWLEGDPNVSLMPIESGLQGLSVIRFFAHWLADFKIEGHSEDFPFVQPSLDFYGRCVRVNKALNYYQKKPPIGKDTRRALERLHRYVKRICDDEDIAKIVQKLRARVDLWEELRSALRLVPPEKNGSTKSRTYLPRKAPTDQATRELQDIQKAVETLCHSLHERRPKVAKDQQSAIDTILSHVEKYQSFLWGHVIKLADGRVKVVDRTNNPIEIYWGSDKRGERRRSGHKNLTHDLETKLADSQLDHNFDQPDFVKATIGKLENLPREFARLDEQLRQKALAQPRPADPQDRHPMSVLQMPAPAETDRALDRQIFRAKNLTSHIEAAGQAGLKPMESPYEPRIDHATPCTDVEDRPAMPADSTPMSAPTVIPPIAVTDVHHGVRFTQLFFSLPLMTELEKNTSANRSLALKPSSLSYRAKSCRRKRSPPPAIQPMLPGLP